MLIFLFNWVISRFHVNYGGLILGGDMHFPYAPYMVRMYVYLRGMVGFL